MSNVTPDSSGVFINCPFDDAYRPLFIATVFAVIACGFKARCALEVDDGGQMRMDKLYDLIGQCPFSIHDISRVELDPVNGLPRFNMPLELGIFLGAKRFGDPGQKRKRLLIHDKEKYRYQQFISDLAGMDVKAHNDDPAKVIANIHSMMATNTRLPTIPTKVRLARSYGKFYAALPALLQQDELDHTDLLFAELENLIIAWVKRDVQLSTLPSSH